MGRRRVPPGTSADARLYRANIPWPRTYNGLAGPPELASARRWPAFSCPGKFLPSRYIAGCSPELRWPCAATSGEVLSAPVKRPSGWVFYPRVRCDRSCQKQQHRSGGHTEEDERPQGIRGLPRADVGQQNLLPVAEAHELGHCDADPDPGGQRCQAEGDRHSRPCRRGKWSPDDPRKQKYPHRDCCASQRAQPPGETRLGERLPRKVQARGPTASRISRRRAPRLGHQEHPNTHHNPDGHRRQSRDGRDTLPHDAESYCVAGCGTQETLADPRLGDGRLHWGGGTGILPSCGTASSAFGDSRFSRSC